jgi:hypothetical protein
MLTGESFVCTPGVWTSVILKLLKLPVKNYDIKVTFNGMTSLLSLIEIYEWVQKFIGGGGNMHTHEGDLIRIDYFSLGWTVS